MIDHITEIQPGQAVDAVEELARESWLLSHKAIDITNAKFPNCGITAVPGTFDDLNEFDKFYARTFARLLLERMNR